MRRSLWQSVSGYVMISMEGLALERFVNDALRAGIPLQHVCRRSRSQVDAVVSLRDFKRLHGIRKGRAVRIRILEKHGLGFLLWRLHWRRVLLWGWIPLALLLLIGSRFLWFVRIEGCYRVPAEDVLALLEKLEVRVGTPVSKIDQSQIGRQVMAADDRIAWAGTQRSGVVLTVTIVETKPLQFSQNNGQPASVYAQQDGVVESITVIRGHGMVKPGEVVTKGQLLISGNLTSSAGIEYFVQAQGSVIARVSRQAVASQSAEEPGLVRTGVSVPYCRISAFGWELFPLPEEYSDWAFERDNIRILQGTIPLEAAGGRLYQLEQGEVPLSRKQMEQRALLKAQAALLHEIPETACILSKSSTVQFDQKGRAIAAVTIQTEEEIGVQGAMEEIPPAPSQES